MLEQRCLLRDELSHEAVIEKIQQYGLVRVEESLSNYQNVCPNENSDLKNFFSFNKNCGDGPTVCENESFPILITNDQGLLEIHIMSLQLTSMANEIFCNEGNIKDLSLFVSWDLWHQERAFTCPLKYPKFNFNSTSIHRVTRLFEFFDQVLGQTISLAIHVSHRGNTSCPVAKAYLSIKDILDHPQSKFHYVVDFSSTLPCFQDETFGQLSLWVRLDCDLEKIEMFKKRKGIPHRPLANKKNRKIEVINQPVRKSDERIKSISSKFNEFRTNHWKKLDRKNSQIDKKASMIFQENNINSAGSLNSVKMSQSSKNFGIQKYSPEMSSSTLGQSINNEKSTNNSLARNSKLTISQEVSIIKKSDSSVIHAMEDEDTTSEEIRSEEKRRETRFADKSLVGEGPKTQGKTEKSDSASIDEFNELIHRGTVLSPRESRSSVRDLGNVFMDDNWHKYRRKTIAPEKTSLEPSVSPVAAKNRSQTLHRFSDISDYSCDAVIIRIESLTLFPRCPLLDDPKIHQLYVEFSFLGYRGAELETISVPKPAANTKAYFNYMRKFEFDEEEHLIQRNIMRDILTEVEDSTIIFILVSEPLAEEMETKDCEEVGYAFFNIRDHILKGRSKDVSLTIMNIDRTEPIGILKITLLGAEPLRRCILDF